MEDIAIAALWTLTGFLSLIAAYLAIVTLGSWLYRPAPGGGRRESRIAVLVPAHNESSGIIPTLRDLCACDYPARLRDIFVIADNCTDDTAEIARAHGAQVFERHDTTLRGKGQALDWFLAKNRDLLSRHDVIAIVDADMTVDGQFLSVLDDAFAIGRTAAVQGKYLASNPEESWISAFGFLGFAVANHVRPAGRCFLGSSAGLKGSGMAFRRDLLLRLGWPCKSVAEDLEFGKELALQGIRILYVPGCCGLQQAGRERVAGLRATGAMGRRPGCGFAQVPAADILRVSRLRRDGRSQRKCWTCWFRRSVCWQRAL